LEYYDPRDFDLAGRTGKLKTLHGVIETPYLFPVVDPIRQMPNLDELRNIGFTAFITNAYLFYRRNKGQVRSIHEFFNWNGPIMTDSGGYQILLYGSVDAGNREIVEYEKAIGSDIAVILDVPTGASMSFEEAWSAVKETFRRAWEALPLIMDSKQLWVLPVQGAPYLDLLKYSALASRRLPYHIYALGSPTLYLERYAYEDVLEYTIIARMSLPPEKPLHVFGVGHPMILPFLVAVGADLFDSASYILYARDERMMFPWGTRKLSELQYLPCTCPVCSKYSVEELREMTREERVKKIAVHNLYVLRKELDSIKQAIKDGRLWEYLEYRSKAHPSLRRTLVKLKKYAEYLKLYNPYAKGTQQAILLLDRISTSNPRLRMNKKRVYEVLVQEKRDKVLLIPALVKPFTQQELYLRYKNYANAYRILFYHPYLGLFPPEASNTYPFFQHEIGILEYSREIALEMARTLIKMSVKEVNIVVTEHKPYLRICKFLVNALKDSVEKIEIIHA